MRKLSISLLILLSLCLKSFAQDEKVVFNSTITYSDGTNYRVIESLTLKPPFSHKASTDGSWHAYTVDQLPSQIPPSLGQNFIRKETILVKNVDSESEIYGLGVESKSTTFQYFDGLGREMQNVMAQASPAKRDVIQPIAYNAHGRLEKEYLPYTKSVSNDGGFRSSAITEQSTFYNGSTSKVADDSKPWIKHEYEQSPLNRVLETFGAGEAWQTGSSSTEKSTQFAVKTNASNTVKKWTINSSGLPRWSTYYGANTLLLNETTTDATTSNSDDQVVQEYRDSRELLILKRVKIGSSSWMDTYYIYDEWGSVVMVLPPVLSDIASPTATNVSQLAFQYEYDEKRRLKRKKLPGTTHWHEMIYDKWDRLAMTQDPNQVENGEYMITKYDMLNRPIVSGLYSSGNDAEYWRGQLATKNIRYETLVGSVSDYTSNVTPKPATNNTYTITFYDAYNFFSVGWGGGNSYSFVNEPGFSGVKNNNVKGQTTGSKVKVLGRSDHIWLHTVTYYDEKYRVLQTITENIRGGVERVTFEYDFVGRVLKSKHVQTNDGGITILKEFEYDHAGRLLKVWHTIDSQSRILMAENEYNEAGELVEKNLHSTNSGSTFLQSIDYRYNIRGWLTHINNSTLDSDANNDDTNDLYGAELSYASGYTVNGHAIKARYDGNISAIKWRTNNLEETSEEQIFGYDYDLANRLDAARYATKSGSNWTGKGGDYDVTIDGYDKNGNITALTRKGNGSLIDDLNYGYKNSGKSNRLDYVSEGSNNALGFKEDYTLTNEYDYDASGNMKVDLNKGITDITYNHLNLPTEVEWSDGRKIKFQYDAAGIKLRKEVYPAGSSTPDAVTDYTAMGQFQDDELEFVFTDEGRALKKDNAFEYEYFLKDHLGNNRVAFGMLTEVDFYQATMETSNTAIKNDEESTFDNMPGGTRIANSGYNKTPISAQLPAPNTVVSVRNGIGPSIMFSVKKDDKLEISVYGGYPVSNAGNGAVAAGNFAAAAATAFGVSPTGETSHIFEAFDDFAPVLGAAGGGSSNTPRGYLNYIIFNSTYTDAHYGMVPISAEGYQDMELLEGEITANFDGTAYIYVANESDASTADIFFDELTITHTKNEQSLQVTQTSDFYPFGMKMQPTSYQHEGHNENRYTYNGKEAIDDHDLAWQDYGARMYDGAIGRWNHIDPLANKYLNISPYSYALNNPILQIDPDGKDVNIFHLINYDPYSGEYDKVKGHSNSRTSEAFQAFLKTDIGRNIVADYARTGDRIGGIKFEKDGKYADHTLEFLEFDGPRQARAQTSIGVTKGKVKSIIKINTAYLDRENGDEQMSITLGHESIFHFEKYAKPLAEAIDKKDKSLAQKIYSDYRKSADSEGKVDHDEYRNKESDVAKEFEKLMQQLSQFLDAQKVQKAKSNHDENLGNK